METPSKWTKLLPREEFLMQCYDSLSLREGGMNIILSMFRFSIWGCVSLGARKLLTAL